MPSLTTSKRATCERRLSWTSFFPGRPTSWTLSLSWANRAACQAPVSWLRTSVMCSSTRLQAIKFKCCGCSIQRGNGREAAHEFWRLATRRQCAGAAPLAQPLFFWPHVTRAAVAGDTGRRGGVAVAGGGLACSGAAGQSPVGAQHCLGLAARGAAQQRVRAGAVPGGQRGLGTVGECERGGPGVCQPAPAQPVRHTDQHGAGGFVLGGGAGEAGCSGRRVGAAVVASRCCAGVSGGECSVFVANGFSAVAAGVGDGLVVGRLAQRCGAAGAAGRCHGVCRGTAGAAAIDWAGAVGAGGAGAVSGRRAAVHQPAGAVAQCAGSDRPAALAGLGLGRVGLCPLHHALPRWPGRPFLRDSGQRPQPAAATRGGAGPARCAAAVWRIHMVGAAAKALA